MTVRRLLLASIQLLILGAGASGAVVAAGAARSADGVPAPESLRSCGKIVGDADRLACFDRELARMTHDDAASKGAAGVAGAAGAAGVAAARVLTPEQKMGLSGAKVQQLESGTLAAAPIPNEVHAHIASSSSSGDGRQVFVLDDGQVWRQTELKSDFSVHQGDAVTLASGVLGSYWLSTNSHHATRVKRVR